MKVTRIAKNKALNPVKYQRLRELALRLGRLRKQIWQEYGSLKGIALSHRDIRDQWSAEKRSFDVPARLWKETLRSKEKYQARNRLYAIAKNKPHKADHIFRNNLGSKRVKERRDKYKTQVKDYISQSVHKLLGNAKVIATEDLTSPIRTYSRGKNQNRRLSAWIKGILATFLNMISHQRGALVVMVNSAYTS